VISGSRKNEIWKQKEIVERLKSTGREGGGGEGKNIVEKRKKKRINVINLL